MSGPSDDRSSVDLSALNDLTVSRMLKLGLSQEPRPIDDLVDRLERADGDEWLQAALRLGPTGAEGDPVPLLIDGEATRPQLEHFKQQVQSPSGAPGTDAALRDMAAYFIVIAAGLVHHDVVMTSRPRAQLDEFLLDLAEVMPAPWATLLARAAENADA